MLRPRPPRFRTLAAAPALLATGALAAGCAAEPSAPATAAAAPGPATPATPAPARSAAGTLAYEESGGFALQHRRIEVAADGRASVEQDGDRAAFRLPAGEARRLFVLAREADASRTPAAAPACCDQVRATLVVGPERLAPEAAEPVTRALRDLLRRHAP